MFSYSLGAFFQELTVFDSDLIVATIGGVRVRILLAFYLIDLGFIAEEGIQR